MEVCDENTRCGIGNMMGRMWHRKKYRGASSLSCLQLLAVEGCGATQCRTASKGWGRARLLVSTGRALPGWPRPHGGP